MISFASIFNDGGPFAPDTPLRGKAERARRTLQELGAALQSQLIDMGVAFEPRFQEFQREVRAEIKSGLTSFEASMRPAIEELKRDLHSTVEQKLEPLARELRQEVQAQFALLQKNSEPAIEPIKRVLTPRLKAIDHQYKPTLQRLKAQAAQRLARLDERYQQLFKEHVDPVLGNAARSELQSMLNDEGAVLRPEERMANRRLGMGAAAFGLALTGSLVYAPATSLAIVVGLMASSAKYPHAWREWKANKRLGAVHLICVYSLYLWLGGYASAGALGAVLYGLMLKARAIGENQSRNNLVALFQLQPDSVWVRVDGQELEIPFAELRVGDVLVVRAGQVIPVDGSVIAGEAAVDQHMLTGESQPVEKSAGDAVLASTLLISGRLDVAVEKTSAETTAGQIAAILNRTAQNTRPPAVSAVAAADRLAVPTLLASLASMPFLGVDGAVCLIGANTTTASYLSGSLAMLNYLNIAARRRILVKEAKSLENLGKVDTVVFDKTGTLTMEQPKVAKVHVFNHLDEQVVLTLAAAAEARQSHPIARAILAAAAEQGLALPVVDDAHYEVGYGIRVRLAGSNDHADHPLVRVGSARFMQREGLDLPAQIQALSAVCQVSGHSVVMVAVDRELIGCVELQPSLRPEAQTVIDSLRE
ncbi:MAG: HAD-IC family P-type ATPase, partial [Rhodocyclaceae bacterium]|nr:HAD-IC family P-type ATPase [Rhodocyclaceae bacterium]